MNSTTDSLTYMSVIYEGVHADKNIENNIYKDVTSEKCLDGEITVFIISFLRVCFQIFYIHILLHKKKLIFN